MRIRRGFAEFATVALISLAAAAHAGLPEQLGVQRLRDELPAGAPIVLDPATGAVEALRGLDLPLPGADHDPGTAAADWVRERAQAFGLGPDDALVVERVEPLRDGSHRVLLRQAWRGFPVVGGDARVVISAAGRLRVVAAGFRVSLAAPAEARVARAAAVTRGVGALGASLRAEPASAALWVRRDPGQDRLAWRVEVTLADGRPATCWVDAATGDVVARDEGIARAVGLVYPTDPRTALAEEPLLRLAGGPGLVNSTFSIEDQQYPLVTPLGPNGDYRYAPTQGGFDQVNVYWHVDRFLHDYVGGLGHPGLPAPLVVRVNAPLEPNVALTTGAFLYFGRPITNFTREPSRSSDIIYHEVTHALLYAAGVQPSGIRREAGALHEGLADFLAAAYTGDPAIGEWLYLQFPNGATRVDQPADPWHADHYDQVAFPGAPQGSVWANGMILSGALWDLRALIGPACDSLVLESMDYLPTEPTWAHFANALVQADEIHHGTRFRSAIVGALTARGVRGAVTMPARIAGPTVLAPGTVGLFTPDPCCGVQEIYVWSARPWCRGVPCGDWRDLGSGSQLSISFDEDTELRLTMSSPWGDELQASRLIGVRPPTLLVEGPREIVQGGVASWTARATAMGPMRIQWQRRWLDSGPLYEFLGEGAGMGFTVERPCEIAVTLVDGLLRTTREVVTVQTFVDRPPADTPTEFRVTQRHDARSRAMETTVDLPAAGKLRMRIYDVRGRERVRLWDGPVGRGAQVFRWNAGSLEPGLYLLRVEGEPNGTVVRFTIVR